MFFEKTGSKFDCGSMFLIQKLYFSDRSFQRAIIRLKRRSYVKVMTPGS
jgi:hypothetical protein